MKYIEIPADVALTRIVDGEPMKDERGQDAVISFKKFLKGRLMDPSFSKDAKSVTRMAKINDAIEVANGFLSLEDGDYDLLATAIRNPSNGMGYDNRCAHCLVPFFKAFEEAIEEDPSKASTT